MKILKRLFLAALLCLAPIAAFAAADSAVVVASCGTAPATYVPGQVYAQTMDTTGRICGAAVTSGGGAVTPGTYIGDTVITSSALATDGIAPVVSGSASSGVVVKASAGNLYGVYATCTANCWLMVFNSTTVPGDGATVAGVASGNLQDCVPIQAGTGSSINYQPGPAEVFTVGISIAISSTACSSKTASTTGYVHASAR